MFKFSPKSEEKLKTVKEPLQKVVKFALNYSTIDFGISEGIRTQEQQKKYLALGKTQTLRSKHLTGDAIDLYAYIEGAAHWEVNVLAKIAEMMRLGALEYDVCIRWGAAWNISDIGSWKSGMLKAYEHYIDTRRKEGRTPFIDAPHFELN